MDIRVALRRRLAPGPLRRAFAPYAWTVLAANLLIILGGALVRATGSGAGCGGHWPLCDGQMVPAFATAGRVIEFSHRMSVSAGVVLVSALMVIAWRAFPAGHPARFGAATSVAFTLSEALIGAALVLFKLVAHDASIYRAVAVSAHLTNTFLLVASLTLTAWWGGGHPGWRIQGQGAAAWLASCAAILVLVVGVSGAVTALGDTLFPASSRSEIGAAVSPTAHFLVRLRVYHPTLALLTAIIVAGCAMALSAVRPGAHARNFAHLVGFLFAAQIGLGFMNLFTMAPLALQLAHLLVADALWICLVLLAASALAVGAPREAFRWPGSRGAAPMEAAP